MIQFATHHDISPPSEADILGEHITELNHVLREQLLATPYLVYMISNNEGKDLLKILGNMEKKAFRVRALSRQSAREHDIDAGVCELLTLIANASERLNFEHCDALQELFDAMFIAIDSRHRLTLDLFIETLLDLRATWSHAASVISRSPI